MSGPGGEPVLGQQEPSALETIKDRWDAYRAALPKSEPDALVRGTFERLGEAIDAAVDAERAREEQVMIRLGNNPDMTLPRAMLPDGGLWPPPELGYSDRDLTAFSFEREALIQQDIADSDIVTWRLAGASKLSREQQAAMPVKTLRGAKYEEVREGA